MKLLVCLIVILSNVSAQVAIDNCLKKETTIFCLKTFKTSWKTCVEQIDKSGCFNGFCANFKKCNVANSKVLNL